MKQKAVFRSAARPALWWCCSSREVPLRSASPPPAPAGTGTGSWEGRLVRRGRDGALTPPRFGRKRGQHQGAEAGHPGAVEEQRMKRDAAHLLAVAMRPVPVPALVLPVAEGPVLPTSGGDDHPFGRCNGEVYGVSAALQRQLPPPRSLARAGCAFPSREDGRCRRRDLNSRPLPRQGSALPLQLSRCTSVAPLSCPTGEHKGFRQ